jgi:hypothetical protein
MMTETFPVCGLRYCPSLVACMANATRGSMTSFRGLPHLSEHVVWLRR